MIVKHLTHQQICDHLVALLATDKVTNADLEVIGALAESRTFTRAEKEAISRLFTKYQYDPNVLN